MGHYNQKTTLASLNRQMAFTKRKLRDCEFEKRELEKENVQLREALEHIAAHNIFAIPQIQIREYARKALERE